MRRREFLEILGGAVVAAPCLANAQVGPDVRRIGVLSTAAPATPKDGFGPSLFRALAQRGYVLDRNLLVDTYGVMGHVDLQLPISFHAESMPCWLPQGCVPLC